MKPGKLLEEMAFANIVESFEFEEFLINHRPKLHEEISSLLLLIDYVSIVIVELDRRLD